MSEQTTVLSLNPDGKTLLGHERALRESGFKVISVSAPVDARFEIEMGRCGIFLSSYLTSVPILRDLSDLFRRSCPAGLIVFLGEQPINADIAITDRDDPQSTVDKIRSKQRAQVS